MNAFSQQDFKGAYNSASMQQLKSLADHGYTEAQELLAIGLSDEQVSNVSTPSQLSLLARLTRWFWAYTESSYEAWSAAGRPRNGI